MNCDIAQRRLMSIEDPAQVPADLRAHLASCGSCRDWQGHLVQLERHIPFLPVPVSRARSRFVRKLTAGHKKKQEAEQTVPEAAAFAGTIAAPALAGARATRARATGGNGERGYRRGGNGWHAKPT